MKVGSVIGFAVVAAALAVAAQAEDVVAPKIAAIHAQLFHENNGTFSADLLGANPPALWNTIIGEGESGGASNFTFVTVEVVGKDVPQGKVFVEVVARDDRRHVWGRAKHEVSIYDQKAKFLAPLWLNQTGCEPLEISARLMTKRGAVGPVVKRVIPFRCGE